MNPTNGTFVVAWADAAGVHAQMFDSQGSALPTASPLVAVSVPVNGTAHRATVEPRR